MLIMTFMLGFIAAIVVAKYSFGASDTDEEFNSIFDRL
jgi:hypothetical protein